MHATYSRSCISISFDGQFLHDMQSGGGVSRGSKCEDGDLILCNVGRRKTNNWPHVIKCGCWASKSISHLPLLGFRGLDLTWRLWDSWGWVQWTEINTYDAMAEGKKGKEGGSKKASPERPGSAKPADKKSDKESPKRASSAGKSKPNSPKADAKKGENAASGSPKRPNSPNKSQQGATALPVLPLGQRENNRNQFNLAKARADAAAMQTGAPGSRTSTHPSSRRQSGSSQVSFSSK